MDLGLVRNGALLPSPPPVPMVDAERCTGCSRCVDACPTAAIVVRQPTAAFGALVVIDASRCTYCTACEAACPEAAIDCPFEIALG